MVSTAVPEDNAERQEALRRGLPILHRSEALAAIASLSWPIAVSGTHGKTTTTAMIAAVLEAGGLDPTVVNGGILEGLGSNAKLGQGVWAVIEADESDRSFLNLPATLAVVTNIEAEHMEHYRDLAEIEACFTEFADSVPPFGSAILSADMKAHAGWRSGAGDRCFATGLRPTPIFAAAGWCWNQQAAGWMCRASRTSRPCGSACPAATMRRTRSRLSRSAIFWAFLRMPFAGRSRSSGACSAGSRLRAKWMACASSTTTPITRPEIAAVLATARLAGCGRIMAVMQPHRYTRLNALP